MSEYTPYTQPSSLPTPPPVTPRARHITQLVYFALFLIALGLAIFAYWSAQSTEVLTINKNPLPERTIREHPTAGGVVILTADICKNINVTGDLRLSYVSQTREIFIPVGKDTSPKGCKKTDFPLLIPVGIPPDTYRIKFHVSYDINPIKKGVVQEFYSEPITVVAPGDPTAVVAPIKTGTNP